MEASSRDRADCQLSPQYRAGIKQQAGQYFTVFLVLALVSAVGFVLGLLVVHLEGPGAPVEIGDNVLGVVVGLAGFMFFFPMFVAGYFTRHLLARIEKLEEVAGDADSPPQKLD